MTRQEQTLRNIAYIATVALNVRDLPTQARLDLLNIQHRAQAALKPPAAPVDVEAFLTERGLCRDRERGSTAVATLVGGAGSAVLVYLISVIATADSPTLRLAVAAMLTAGMLAALVYMLISARRADPRRAPMAHTRGREKATGR